MKELGLFFCFCHVLLKKTIVFQISSDEDRMMICGSMAMLKDCARMCEGFSLI